MSTIPASEIKRRGISIVDEALKKGPVHVIQRNRLRYVILDEADYRQLARQPEHAGSVWDVLLDRPWQGTRAKQDIDAQIAEERSSWDEH